MVERTQFCTTYKRRVKSLADAGGNPFGAYDFAKVGKK
jgi:hypothetical protein